MLNRIALVVAIAGLLVYSAVFTVDQREYAIKLQFGKIVRTDYEPGLHFKIPLVNSVLKFENRILGLNNPTERFLTAEKKNLSVDFFVRWQIVDVAAYYRSTGGDLAIASQRLLEIIKGRTKTEFAKRTVKEVVTAERSEMMGVALDEAREAAEERLGLTILDIRVKRIEFPEEVVESVLNRMRQERRREAARWRAEGEEAATLIRAEAERERTEILANAYREAEETRGEGDAKASEIYANAYNGDPEFYAFYRSMQAYRNSLGRDGDILVLKPDSEFFRYLNRADQ